MNRRSLLLIEIVWIILGTACLAIAIREIVINGFGKAWLFLAMSAVAFILARMRDSQRKKL
jgi:hypothetical protein